MRHFLRIEKVREPLSLLTLFLFLSSLIYLQDFSHHLYTDDFQICHSDACPELQTFKFIHLANTYWVPITCQVLRIEKQIIHAPRNSCPSLFTDSTYMSPTSSHPTYINFFLSLFPVALTSHSGWIRGNLFLSPSLICSPWQGKKSDCFSFPSRPLSPFLSVLVQVSTSLTWTPN